MRTPDRPPCVLVVSEDPSFIVEIQNECRAAGARTVGCLGPAHSPCYLDVTETCPLATESLLAIVDAPDSGSFRYHTRETTAGAYAEAIALRHPRTLVVLCGAGEGDGPTGEVTCIDERADVLDLLRWGLAGDRVQRTSAPV